jgi:hypothetical protein
MRKTLMLATALLVAVSATAADLTVDEILAKNLEAKGGAGKIKALQSVSFTGSMRMGAMEFPLTIVKKRPEMTRIEFTVQGVTGIQAYDGRTGWMVMPFMGQKDPETMPADMLSSIREQADFDGQYIDYAKKGHKVELLGMAQVDDRPAYKLKLTTRDGVETIISIDAETFLEVRMEGKRTVQGRELEAETKLGNYQEVGGLRFPFSIEMKAKGAPGGQSISITKAELNPTLANEVFKMPAKKVEPEPVKQ